MAILVYFLYRVAKITEYVLGWFFTWRHKPVKISSSENIKHSAIHVQSMFIIFTRFVNSTHNCVDIIIIHIILLYERCEMAGGSSTPAFLFVHVCVWLIDGGVSVDFYETNQSL